MLQRLRSSWVVISLLSQSSICLSAVSTQQGVGLEETARHSAEAELSPLGSQNTIWPAMNVTIYEPYYNVRYFGRDVPVHVGSRALSFS